VQDVVAHLTTVDRFWKASVDGGVAGTPTQFLAGFDPKATPAALVDAVRDASPGDTLASFLDASGAFCAAIETLDDAGWDALAESPPGHVTMSALVHHALWDAWVHERDIMLPLGQTPDEEPDEIVASLRYVAALSPVFAVQSGTAGAGVLAVVVERPSACILVTVDDSVHVSEGEPPDDALVVMGDAVEVLEALSVRLPMQQMVAPEHAWLLAGLTSVFETTA
jgi:hypothetical protein